MGQRDLRYRLRITWMVALIAAVQLAGTLLFSSGFLLSRTSVSQVSSPSDSHATADEVSAPFDKVVMLIVDAFRLDFLVPQAYTGAGAQHAGAMTRTLQRIQQLVRSSPPCSSWCSACYAQADHWLHVSRPSLCLVYVGSS